MSNKRLFTFIVVIFAILAASYFAFSNSYLIFHTFVEIFISTLYLMIFAVAVNSAVIAGNDFYKFLGVSMLFVAFIEILHMLAYKEMGVFPNITTNTPTQLWVLARYLEAFTFLFAPFFYHKKKVNINLVLSVFAIITVLGVFSIFKLHTFPDCYIDGYGLTAFKKISEYIIMAILILAGVNFYSLKGKLDKNLIKLFLVSIIFAIASGFCFTLYFSVYAFSNALGHIFKAISVFIVYLIFAYTAIREPSKIVFAEIENERSTFKEYLEKMPAIVLAMDTSGRIILANSRACEVLECSKEELVNGSRLFYNFYPESEKEKAQEGFKRVISGDFQKYENIKRKIITKSGKRKIVEFRNSLIYDRDGKIVGVLATGEDVTEKEMYEKKLKDLASLDSLTGVLNKRAGFDALNETIKEANLNKSNFTICFMDVDNLKLVNDKYGHKVGDEYLTKIAKTLLNVLRKDDYVIRFGGDEFLLVLKNCSESNAISIMKRAEQKLAELFNAFDVPTGISYGFAEFDYTNPLSADELIKIADEMMYKMKKEHKNNCNKN